jgi:hypothetical protein
MKRLFTIIIIIIPTIGIAQKKSNLLVDVGAFAFNVHSSNLSGKGPNFTKPIGSLLYSYAPTGRLAIGAGVEVGQMPKGTVNSREQDDPTIAAFLDLRYYTKGKNVFFPFFQPGYNFFSIHDSYSDGEVWVVNDVSSIAQFSVGLGYSRAVTEKGAGPFVAVKFQDQVYKGVIEAQIPSQLKRTTTINYSLIGFAATIGFRF